MTDRIIVALTASLAKEYLSRKVRLTSWLLIVVVGSMQTGRYTGHRSLFYQNRKFPKHS